VNSGTHATNAIGVNGLKYLSVEQGSPFTIPEHHKHRIWDIGVQLAVEEEPVGVEHSWVREDTLQVIIIPSHRQKRE
jgi:hypothetical protein